MNRMKKAVLSASVSFSFTLACAAGPVLAADLVVVSFGGNNKDAQTTAFYEPFQKTTGVKLVAGEYSGELAKIKAMVDTRSVNWDVVEVGSSELARGCEEGLFEQLDWARIGDGKELIDGAVQPCGAGIFVWSTVLAYDGDRLKEGPTSWKDFWDVKKFPGKRAMHKGALYSLEIALLADGVDRKEVYKTLGTSAGVDRAFKKLDQLKPHIQWWEAGAQPAQYLVAGDVVMSTAYNGRIANAQKEGKNLKIVWDGNIYDFDYWAIPRGSRNVAEAQKFIAFASRPENQKVFSETIAYGPASKKALALVSKKPLGELPNAPQNNAHAVVVDTRFWTEYGESLEQRFNAWAAR